ncbi:glutathione peroxidase [Sediminibacterium roseum]|nr:glutathione peroxidase [Sediminibacterium roseum]
MKKLLIGSVVILVCLTLIKRKDMTWRQSFLKTVYPLLMLKSKWFPGKTASLLNPGNSRPYVPFYGLTAVANDGTVIDLHRFSGKKILLVNTASDCGYTGQYDELEQLHRQFKDLVVIGFPANDFKQQEKADDASIAQFCKINFGVSFPLMQKTHVVKTAEQNAVFDWLSHKEKNGWCNQAPVWNFCKYVVNEEGVLLGFFDQSVSPLDARITGLLQK